MDELKIVSDFARGMLSKIIGVFLRKKTGCNIDIRVQDVRASIVNDKAFVHLDLNAEMSKEELKKLLKNIGLS